MKKLTLQQLIVVATERNGKCLSTEYHGNHHKYLWECKDGHTWEATYNNVKTRGSWCPRCSGQLLTIQDMQRYAESRGGSFESAIYTNSISCYNWKCSQGHVWQAPGHIFKDKQWCPYCSGRFNNSVQTLQAHAVALGGKFLSTNYKSLKTKYLWECKEGHTWKTTADNVLHKHSWCPKCFSKHSNLQQEIYAEIIKVFPEAVANQRNILPNGRFELDIYLPSKKRAIEFDGVYWHARPIAQERDSRKERECAEQGIQLMRIAEMDYLQDKIGTIAKAIQFLTVS